MLFLRRALTTVGALLVVYLFVLAPVDPAH